MTWDGTRFVPAPATPDAAASDRNMADIPPAKRSIWDKLLLYRDSHAVRSRGRSPSRRQPPMKNGEVRSSVLLGDRESALFQQVDDARILAAEFPVQLTGIPRATT